MGAAGVHKELFHMGHVDAAACDWAGEVGGFGAGAREFQQMGVELQPGDGDTGFRDVLQGVGQLVRGVEVFMLAAGARDIQALGQDVLPSMTDRLQDLPVASDAVELERAAARSEMRRGPRGPSQRRNTIWQNSR